MSPAIAFITSLKRREFIGDIYFHSKKIENIFDDPGHGERKTWYHMACNHSNRLHHQSASQLASVRLEGDITTSLAFLPPSHSSPSISPVSVVMCITLL